MDIGEELAKKWLEEQTIEGVIHFRGVPLSKFNEGELQKIIYLYSRLMKRKDDTISLLSRTKVWQSQQKPQSFLRSILPISFR